MHSSHCIYEGESTNNYVSEVKNCLRSGFNTDYGSSEPLKTLVMLCYVMLDSSHHI